MHTQEWLIKCLAACLSLSTNFELLTAMLEQAAVGTAPLGTALADLLETGKGNCRFKKHTERIRALAGLIVVPKTDFSQLF